MEAPNVGNERAWIAAESRQISRGARVPVLPRLGAVRVMALRSPPPSSVIAFCHGGKADYTHYGDSGTAAVGLYQRL